MEKLLAILKRIKPDVDFTKETGLIDKGILTSMDVVKLVMEISSEFDIQVSPLYVIPSNFNSLQAIFDMIEKIEEE